ncbi:hypothetical protein [Streptomyces sp. UNOC14_S4]|uniref:hypothetical protein n=1 Tax=Streptomyces sp. UNOC14_S4 TaxID=2872340 RepID=UPI001E3DFEE5|nr:hypothetical protein [Streptomyces sp. UNOC14_S4]MCC3769255.1 hypothetical protein [Streptomyces sp. UNOC14_S4]
MTRAVDAVEAAAIALGQGAWIPHAEEQAMGSAFLTHRDALEPRLLPGVPAHPDPQGWISQHIFWLEDAAALAVAVRDQWYRHLPTSHMTALINAYAEQAAVVTPLADQLAAVWAAEPPESLSPEQITWWEEWHVPAAERQQLDAVTHRLIVIGSVVVAAVTGAWQGGAQG